ncbi:MULTISPECIES: SpoIIE family protein phosphatase [Kitasatospora]|uniref:Putative serine/threonine protein phosphatase n=1 Tax=Kitasatospora setae (strain ATCC 33774 / DSM 43861 / JCM 3304 / KCC A-0304 / NBRC 14216 / KM-6054) TaxID=452652 RepID=E4NAH6_KITSK|nr:MULTISPECIES: SpoIIE family protein phosphatase [Kitasatospora]BAJ28207.1 putative serine/threonine protein phosphatase [Kitasatospora setae KM-6054]
MADDLWAALPRPLRQVLDGTAAGVAILDTGLRYRYVNPALAGMNGVPAALHLGRTIAELLPDVDAREDVLRAVLADGRSRETTSSGHTRAAAPPHRRFWHGAYHRIDAEDGRPLGLVGIVLEVTASRRQQHELEQARARLALLDAAATQVGTTLDVDTTCGELAAFLVAHLADAATVELLPHPDSGHARPRPGGGRRLRRAALAADPALLPGVRRLGDRGEHVDYQPGSAIPRCLDSGRPVIENLLDDTELARSAPNAARVALYRELGIHSAVIVPLTARGQRIGTVTLMRAGTSPGFTGDDAVAAQDLAGRTAITLDNAGRYSREHAVAVDLQRAMLAEPGHPHPDVDVAFRYRPAGTGSLVGGDWYETVALPDGRTVLAIGDVMGHGIEAAAHMSHYQAMLRAMALLEPTADRLLTRMDGLACEVHDYRPSTCLVVYAEPARGRYALASAGHLPPAVVRPDGALTLLPVEPGPPLGTGLNGYVPTTAVLPPGHTLLLYTDGLVERRDEDIDRSLARLTALRLPAGATPARLLDAVLAHAPAPAEDDIALLAAAPAAALRPGRGRRAGEVLTVLTGGRRAAAPD